jgi:hypothetical protein
MNETETTMQLTKVTELSYVKYSHATYRANIHKKIHTHTNSEILEIAICHDLPSS